MGVVQLAIMFFVGAVVFGALPYTTSNVVTQGLYLALMSAFFSIFLGLVAVNLVLNSKERKRAAYPLLRLIASQREQGHNFHSAWVGHIWC